MFIAKNSPTKNFPRIRKKNRGEEFSGEEFADEECFDEESSSEEFSGNPQLSYETITSYVSNTEHCVVLREYS
jgi:hypothetical protein